MHRVSVVGVPGSGKTRVGRQVAASLGVPFIELDSIFHQPGWVELPVDDFRKRVTEALPAPAWVVDGNYSAVRDLVWQRADTVVWLDLPRRRVMSRIILRTVRRTLTRERLWNNPPFAGHRLELGHQRRRRDALRRADREARRILT